MTFALSPDTDREEIAEGVTDGVDREAVRTSASREHRLTKNVRRQARTWDATVEIDVDFPTACVKMEPGEPPEVVISGREIEQHVTSYDGRTWDWIVQSAFGVHEVAHVRWTDLEHWNDLVDERVADGNSPMDDSLRGTAASLQNALEDGAIEQSAVRRWSNFYDRLRALRANLFADPSMGIENPVEGGYVYPMAHAIHTACLDLWTREVYGLDIGVLGALLDPANAEHRFVAAEDRSDFVDRALPAVNNVVADVLTLSDSHDRNQRIIEFVEEIADILDDAESDGKSQKNGEEGDGEDRSGMPDDARESETSGGSPMEASELEEIDASEIDQIEISDDPADGSPVEITGDLDDLADVEIDVDLDDQAGEEAADDARASAGVTDDLLDELEETAAALGESDTRLDSPEVQVATEDWDLAEDRFERAKALADVLDLSHLEHTERDTVEMHRRRGRFTGRGGAARRARQGERHVKEQVVEADEKDYWWAFALDRSGSMSGDDIKETEVVLGAFAIALERIGVDVMIYELYSSTCRLAKPFGVSVEERPERIFNGRASGGTPLGETLELAKSRLDALDGQKVLTVVTDDEVSGGTRRRVEDVLSASNYPVIGVNITHSVASSTENLYTRSMVSEADESDLSIALKRLCEEVMI